MRPMPREVTGNKGFVSVEQMDVIESCLGVLEFFITLGRTLVYCRMGAGGPLKLCTGEVGSHSPKTNPAAPRSGPGVTEVTIKTER